MKALLLVSFTALGAVACGPPSTPPVPDAGVDASCGIDCDSQRRYSLLLKRCFEYSKTYQGADPADLGVLVSEVRELEGGVKALEVEYRERGQTRMTDFFTFKQGELYLVRRTFLPGESVNYRDGAGNIVGVPWLRPSSLAGETITASVKGDLLIGAQRTTDDTTHRVILSLPTTDELRTPQKNHPEGLRLQFAETPKHGSDALRVFVKDTGFVMFAAYFSPTSTTTAQEYRLQKVRDIAAGDVQCGFGSP